MKVNARHTAKKGLALLLFVLALTAPLTFAGCGNDAGGQAVTSGAPTETDAPDTAPPAPAVTVVGAGFTEKITVIRPENANGLVKGIAAEYRKVLSERTGVDFSIADDFLIPGKTEDADAYEIIVGDTARALSVKLKEKLAATGRSCRGILVEGHRAAVLGTTDILTYRAADDLLGTLLSPDGEKQKLTLTDGFCLITEAAEGEESAAFEIADLLAEGKGLKFYATDVVATMPKLGGYSVMQGGGTDGEYAYYALNVGGTPGSCRLVKYSLADWSLVKTGSIVEAGHSNDITFDPTRNLLAICTNCARDSWSGICFVDRDTLEMKSCDVLVNNCAIEFCKKTGGYVFETWSTVEGKTVFTTVHTDADFHETSRWYQGNSEHTCQGFCVDGDYLLCVRYVSGKTDHFITVHDLDGNFVGKIPLSGALGEPENLFRSGDCYYLGCNKVNKVYRVVLMPDKFW